MSAPVTEWGRGARAGVALVLTVLTVLVAAVCAWTRVVVSGDSMQPTLRPGDRLLVRRGRRARRGDIVVIRAPGDLEVVKRLAGVAGDVVVSGGVRLRLGAGEIAVLGDAPERSTDSRRWGPLPAGAVRGRAVAVYHPPERARRLRPVEAAPAG